MFFFSLLQTPATSLFELFTRSPYPRSPAFVFPLLRRYPRILCTRDKVEEFIPLERPTRKEKEIHKTNKAKNAVPTKGCDSLSFSRRIGQYRLLFQISPFERVARPPPKKRDTVTKYINKGVWFVFFFLSSQTEFVHSRERNASISILHRPPQKCEHPLRKHFSYFFFEI